MANLADRSLRTEGRMPSSQSAKMPLLELASRSLRAFFYGCKQFVECLGEETDAVVG
jgi:hypothetical protein